MWKISATIQIAEFSIDMIFKKATTNKYVFFIDAICFTFFNAIRAGLRCTFIAFYVVEGEEKKDNKDLAV